MDPDDSTEHEEQEEEGEEEEEDEEEEEEENWDLLSHRYLSLMGLVDRVLEANSLMFPFSALFGLRSSSSSTSGDEERDSDRSSEDSNTL